MDVLHVIGRGNDSSRLDLLSARDLWLDIGSRQAFEALRHASPGALPVRSGHHIH